MGEDAARRHSQSGASARRGWPPADCSTVPDSRVTATAGPAGGHHLSPPLRLLAALLTLRCLRASLPSLAPVRELSLFCVSLLRPLSLTALRSQWSLALGSSSADSPHSHSLLAPSFSPPPSSCPSCARDAPEAHPAGHGPAFATPSCALSAVASVAAAPVMWSRSHSSCRSLRPPFPHRELRLRRPLRLNPLRHPFLRIHRPRRLHLNLLRSFLDRLNRRPLCRSSSPRTRWLLPSVSSRCFSSSSRRWCQR